MMPESTLRKIDDDFTDEYNKLQKLYDDNQLDQCIKDAPALLDDPAMPRFHRMKTISFLASCHFDFEKADECRAQAEAYWRIERACYKEGQSEAVDKELGDLRLTLDELKEAFAKDFKT